MVLGRKTTGAQIFAPPAANGVNLTSHCIVYASLHSSTQWIINYLPQRLLEGLNEHM